MSLKQKLLELKRDIYREFLHEDYEFYTELEDHPLGNQNIYRLHYMDYYRIGEGYGKERPNNIGCTNWPFKPFSLPLGMSREDAFKVLSYLTDFIEKNLKIKSCSFESVSALDRVIDLERLGFKRLDIILEDDSQEVIDLFTLRGRILLFKQSKYYQKYFEWYTEGVTFNEVKNIYQKCGIEFYDLVPLTNKEKTNYPVLKKIK